MYNNESDTRFDTFRPIHYLGSKLRLLPEISQAIKQVAPNAKVVCDLFAGSGTVSHYLSSTYTIIATDVQEYSRVLCEGMLFPLSRAIHLEEVKKTLEASQFRQTITNVFEPILAYENNAISEFSSKDSSKLLNLISYGSFIDYEVNRKLSDDVEFNRIILETYKNVIGLGLDKNSNAMNTRYFGGLYFSYNQAIDIDCISEYAFSLPKYDQSVVLSALLSTVSDIVNTIGKQFAQPLQLRANDGRLKNHLKQKIFLDRSISIIDLFIQWLDRYMLMQKDRKSHIVKTMDVLESGKELSKYDIDVIYADPPYTRYHYSRYYHVLETMCKRDNPNISLTDRGDTSQLSRGKYRSDRHQSAFCIASKAEEAFEKLFRITASMKCPLVLSYSPYDANKAVSPRLKTIDELLSIARKFYTSIELKDISKFNHSKLNSSDKLLNTSEISEILILCK